MQWEREIIAKCWEVIEKGGGEVRVQFCRRQDGFVPIIKIYPDNQTIGEVFRVEKEFVK